MRAEQSSRKTNLECRIILEVEESSALELPRAFICQHSDAHYPIARQPLPPLKVSFFFARRGGKRENAARNCAVIGSDRGSRGRRESVVSWVGPHLRISSSVASYDRFPTNTVYLQQEIRRSLSNIFWRMQGMGWSLLWIVSSGPVHG